MSTQDITRWIYDARKRYSHNHMQAGRLITDADWNDNSDAAAEDHRRAVSDLVGPYGSPDEGFRVDNVRITGGSLDFDLLPGTLYLGGMRLHLDQLTTWQTQPDVLLLDTIAPPTETRHDLVLIEACEAPVSGVEDSELIDPALGVDTTQRLMRYQRVRVIPGVNASSCTLAFQEFIDSLEAGNSGTINDNFEWIVDASLTVTFTDEGTAEDLCKPPLTGGYLGAENTAIRVQLVDSSHFTWSLHNATPLYRVSLNEDNTTIVMITLPRDEYSTPQDGQIIEILPWHAVLHNNEKTAAFSGHLTRISTVNTNDDGNISITLADPVPVAEFNRWLDRPDAATLAENGTYYFMRIWNRGADLGSDPAISFTPGTPVTLGTTGIQVTFNGSEFLREDFWVIAARPHTPTQVLPWELETGTPPHGIHRCIAPLALIHYHQDTNAFHVTDCRPHFRSLTELRGCCSYSVGDGKASQGDFNSLEDALSALPADGGHICLLPGLHSANVHLTNRRNITISGCGLRSRIIPRNGGNVFTISHSVSITLRNLNIITVNGSAILANQSDHLLISGVNILASHFGIDVRDMQHVTIRDCSIRILDTENGDVGIHAQGDHLHISGCHLQIVPKNMLPPPPEDNDPDTPPVDPTDPCADPQLFYANQVYLLHYAEFVWTGILMLPETVLENEYIADGGIRIGSGSEQVNVHHNTIIGGAGNGISLGSTLQDVLDTLPNENPDEEEPLIRFDHNADTIQGLLIHNNSPIGSMTIFFDEGSDVATNFTVNSDGTFAGKLPPGTYQVYVSSPNLRVLQIESLQTGVYRVFLEDVPDAQPNPLLQLIAFIYDVTLADNTIQYMGLNGIGVPTLQEEQIGNLRTVKGTTTLLVARQVLLLVYVLTGTITGFVSDLLILRNRITRCARNVDIPEPVSFLFARGMGGISLALSDGLTISENIIENCGRGIEIPICGIYSSLTIDMTIKDNHILNNGHAVLARDIESVIPVGDALEATPVIQPGAPGLRTRAAYHTYHASYTPAVASRFTSLSATAPALRDGPRGAIVIPICLSANAFAGVTDDSLDSETSYLTSYATGRHAARIEGNYVVQPLGKTLFLGALGSLSILDNQLTSDIALSREQDTRAGGLVGALLENFQLGTLDLFPSNVLVMNFSTGGYVPPLLSSLPQDNFPTESFEGPVPLGFPDGNLLFDSNQVKQGNALNRTTSILLFSLDDVSMSNNQIDIFNGNSVLTTSILFAPTTRATNNRLKEPVQPLITDQSTDIRQRRYSIVSINNISGNMINNQGHYCFATLSSNMSAVTEFANHSALHDFLDCTTSESDIAVINSIFLMLMAISVGFTLGLSRQSED